MKRKRIYDTDGDYCEVSMGQGPGFTKETYILLNVPTNEAHLDKGQAEELAEALREVAKEI